MSAPDVPPARPETRPAAGPPVTARPYEHGGTRSLVQQPVTSAPGAVTRPADCRRLKCVALTFDDGPGAHTRRLLGTLAGRQARATFFVLGQRVAQTRRSVLRRMARDGHEIANHSWDHTQLTTLGGRRTRIQLARTQRIVRRVTGLRMRLMRPPYGSTGRKVAIAARRKGLAQILWNVDTYDWRDREASVVARRAARVRPGSIVLMHDIHRTTVDAVPEILRTLNRKGYTFVTVSELFGARTPQPGRRYTERRRRR